MYLVAIKSLYRFFRRGSIVVLDDGSLTSQDRSHLKQHLRSADILHIRDVALADTPKGGTWERLTLISQLVKDSYVVQVDSDSVTINAIPEVLEYVAANSSFTLLGAGSYPGIEPMPNAAQRAQQNGSKSAEPQAISERSLDRFPDSASFKYVRGCSGFAGFARGSFTRDILQQFSRTMQDLCGRPKWNEWGSEQVTSNLLVANSPKAGVLEFPKYTSYYALKDLDYSRSSFVHFMGGFRFANGCYAGCARRVVCELMGDHAVGYERQRPASQDS
jgi:hypothetical protein